LVTHVMDVLDLLRKYSEGGRLGEVRTGRLDDNREVILFGREYAFDGGASTGLRGVGGAEISLGSLVFFAKYVFNALAEGDDDDAEQDAGMTTETRAAYVAGKMKEIMSAYRTEAYVESLPLVPVPAPRGGGSSPSSLADPVAQPIATEHVCVCE